MLPDSGDAEKKPNMRIPPKISNSIFFNLKPLFSQSHNVTGRQTHTQDWRTDEQSQAPVSQISRRHPLKASESTERGWMTQMQLPTMLSTHPHYSLFSHVRLRGALCTETLLFRHCFPLWETEGLQ